MYEDRQKIFLVDNHYKTIYVLGSIHTCHFLCLNYCANYFCNVITIVWMIADVNAPTWYNATHYYANSSCNSSRLKITDVN